MLAYILTIQVTQPPCTAKCSSTEKVLLSSLYVGFHPQTQKLEPPCTA